MHCTQAPPEQIFWLGSWPNPGHSVLSPQLEPQSPLDVQYGAAGSHSATVVQDSAMHWLPRQTSPSLHVLPDGMWFAAQSASSTQQRFGLGFVQPTSATTLKTVAQIRKVASDTHYRPLLAEVASR